MSEHLVSELIEKSTNQYSEIAQLLGNLKSQLEDNSTKMIPAMLDQFNRLSKDARLVDAQIEDYLRNSGEPFSDNISEKLEKRRQVQHDTLQRIEQTMSKANTIKSYLANEFLAVRKGRNAMSGYKSKSRHQGKIVNRSF